MSSRYKIAVRALRVCALVVSEYPTRRVCAVVEMPIVVGERDLSEACMLTQKRRWERCS